MGELNALVKKIHETAKEKGWWDEPRGPLEIHALIHSEIAEATESVRNGEEPFFFHKPSLVSVDDRKNPEGQAVELVDAVIRIMDWFGHNGWDFEAVLKAKMEYNKTRPYRHGGKKY